jgi:hypothetical protein
MVFRLPAVGEVSGEILFRFSFRPFRAMDRLVATGVASVAARGFYWVSFYYVVWLVLVNSV